MSDHQDSQELPSETHKAQAEPPSPESPPAEGPSPLQRLNNILARTDSNSTRAWQLLEDLPEDVRQLLEDSVNAELPQTSPASQPSSAEDFASASPSDEDQPGISQAYPSGDPGGTGDFPQSEIETVSKAESFASSLRDRGYLIEEDASGIRLGGAPVRRGSKSSMLSASELVQFAAEMDGGILPPSERFHCPHCDAVIKPTDTRCTWCSKDLSEPPAADE